MSPDPLPLLPLVLDRVPAGLRLALGQEGVPWRDSRPGPVEGRFVLFDSRTRTRPRLQEGQVPLDIHPLRADWADDPFEALADSHDRLQGWQIGQFQLSERVARFDKGNIRRKLVQGLRELLERAGGIWMRIAPFPLPYRTAFNFRLDHDAFDASDFEAMMEALAGNEGATSHYINASAYESAPEALARLRGLDVGSHGYWHHTYQTARENHRNIGRGIEVLRRAGIEPSGFTAPHGRFNSGLLSALVDLGITHSSDFGLAYDDLPGFVGTSDLVQIPVHPICLGLFLEAAGRQHDSGGQPSIAAAVQATLEHFEHVVRMHDHMREPIFLYGHPDGRLGRYPEVLRHVLAIVGGLEGVWKTTFTEVNRWWRARASLRWRVTRAGDRLVISAECPAPPYDLAIEYWRGVHVAVLPFDQPEIRLAPWSLLYTPRIAQPVLHPVRIDRAEGLRGWVRRVIDWERVTPIDQIPCGDWRNLTKRTLRTLLRK